MTTISFEIEPSEISRLSAILKAYGVKKLKVVEDNSEMTKEDFAKKIERARKSPVKRVSAAEQSKMLGL
jgi:nanoRNase/pAp phosphatase (c-di-AMP/oligoRNAs hydrolase)